MRKANIQKLQKIAADFLQYRFAMILIAKENNIDPTIDTAFYNGACAMIDSFGGEWKRIYNGNDHNKKQLNDIKNYSHIVWFPSDETCEKLNENAWKL